MLDTADVRDYRHLPLLAGTGAAKKTRDLFGVLASAPEIAERMVAAAWIADRRWDITLDNEVVVRLPEDDPAGALNPADVVIIPVALIVAACNCVMVARPEFI